MKKIYRTGFFLVMLFLLSGCMKKASENSGYQVYYTNVGRTSLMAEKYRPDEEEAQKLVGELLEKMRDPGMNTESLSLFPEGVEVREYYLTDGQLTINFNEAYRQMENVSEILLRAGVVKTVMQVKEVKTVVFHIGEDVLRYRSGDPVGAMTAGTFINNPVGINSYQYASLTLYFASKNGEKIVKEMRNVHYSSNTTLEKVVMEQLVKGPMNKQLLSVLPQDLRVLGVSVSGRICTVNLDKKFLEQTVSGVAPEAVIYSMVNSLCDVLGVDKVQFQVNGETDVLFGEKLSLNGPFHRNSDLIEKMEDMGTVETDEEGEAILAEPSIGL